MAEPNHKVAHFIVEYWHMITGVMLAGYWIVIQFTRLVLRNYVTNRELKSHTERIYDRIEKMDKSNQEQHGEIVKMLVDHMDR